MIFCIGIFAVNATAQAATVKEKLPDGSYIVAICPAATPAGADCALYKAMPPSTLRDVDNASQIANGNLDKCQRARAVLDKQIALYEDTFTLLKKGEVKLADAEADAERQRALRYSAMYTMEHDLRLKAEKVNAGGFSGGVNKIFDNPFVKLANEIGKPLLQGWLASRNRTVVTPDGLVLRK